MNSAKRCVVRILRESTKISSLEYRNMYNFASREIAQGTAEQKVGSTKSLKITLACKDPPRFHIRITIKVHCNSTVIWYILEY